MRFYGTKKEAWYVVVNSYNNLILFKTKNLLSAKKAKEKLQKLNPHHFLELFSEMRATTFKPLESLTQVPEKITRWKIPE